MIAEYLLPSRDYINEQEQEYRSYYKEDEDHGEE